MEKRSVRITVIKRLDKRAILDEETLRCAPTGDPKCPKFQEGDTFLVEDLGNPSPIFPCQWAYHDIFKEVMHLALGGRFFWMNPTDSIVVCCTDGLRPVLFKLEAL